MKKLFSLILLIQISYAQQASDYFPQQFGYKWNYLVSILDSANNVIQGMTFFQNDSLAFLTEYNGKEAYHILSKTGTEETISLLPYTDTNYVHLSGSEGYEYFNIRALDLLLSFADSSTINFITPFLGLFESITDWYSVYRFSQNVNVQYQVFSYDTTITIDTLELPLRFLTNGRRLQDDTIETALGTFICKKFFITNSVNYLLIFPPFPPLPVPIFTIEDTVWVAPDNWIVKNIVPSTNIDLSFFELGSYTIPGFSREIYSEPTVIKEDTEDKITFNLEQNYPNPFNPVTNIRFVIPEEAFVSLKVYDILGKEIAIIIDGEFSKGNYEITFDGRNLSSGIYFYTLEYTNIYSEIYYSLTKQMMLIK